MKITPQKFFYIAFFYYISNIQIKQIKTITNMKTKVNTYKADYTNKIIYWTNQLNESLNCAPIDRSTKKMQKSLDSLNYFTEKQIQIERMEEQVNEMCWKSDTITKEKELANERDKSMREWMEKNEREFGIKIINKDEFPFEDKDPIMEISESTNLGTSTPSDMDYRKYTNERFDSEGNNITNER